ncbi:MAG TPA: hypothetical protein VFX18_01235 [Candidatus Nitrosocosmicus sp.]|nr:hypothetical protein [Candidatus Nitrosocosmicus sp.]
MIKELGIDREIKRGFFIDMVVSNQIRQIIMCIIYMWPFIKEKENPV